MREEESQLDEDQWLTFGEGGTQMAFVIGPHHQITASAAPIRVTPSKSPIWGMCK